MLNQTTTLRPAERTELLGFSEIVKIRNRILDLRRQGIPVIQLEGGEPFPPTPDFIKDAMRLALDENQTRYAPSSGVGPLLDAIRTKLSAKNGIEVERDQIIVTSGGAHALFCAFQAILDPGDDLLLFSPYWTPVRDQVRYCGGSLVLAPWSETRDRDAGKVLRARITPRTRALYLNSPSNPTGDVLGRNQLESIARVAIEQDLIVLSDEAYEDIIYDREHVSIASLPGMGSRTLSVFTLSKSFSMTGWRCGYLVAGELWMNPIRKLVLNTTNGVSTPTQYAAAAAVSDHSGYLERMRGEYRTRRDALCAGLASAGFRPSIPHGAFYVFVDVSERLGADSWKAMDSLLDQTGIATVPGIVFGPEGEGHLRMSYSNPVEVLDQAVEALRVL